MFHTRMTFELALKGYLQVFQVKKEKEHSKQGKKHVQRHRAFPKSLHNFFFVSTWTAFSPGLILTNAC